MNFITVDKEKNNAVVRFDVRFYPADRIIKAASEFGESCWVHVDGDPAYLIQVRLIPKTDDIDVDKLGYEFYNYVLHIIRNSC